MRKRKKNECLNVSKQSLVIRPLGRFAGNSNVCNWTAYANHPVIIQVPPPLVLPIPDQTKLQSWSKISTLPLHVNSTITLSPLQDLESLKVTKMYQIAHLKSNMLGMSLDVKGRYSRPLLVIVLS